MKTQRDTGETKHDKSGADDAHCGRLHIVLYGRVQHVGLRYTSLYLARGFYLTGWVRNLPDGSVEMEIQGARSRLRAFFVKLKSMPHIHIEKSDISEIPCISEERKFQIR